MLAHEMISKARTELALLNAEPLLTYVLYATKFIADTGVTTLCTDGLHIWYNPKYLECQGYIQTRSDVLHEVVHIILEHPARLGNKDPYKWNIAADYAANALIKKTKFPLGDLIYAPEFEGMTAEEIYTKLPDRPRNSPDHDDLKDPKKSLNSEQELERKSRIREATLVAIQAQNNFGCFSGEAEHQLKLQLNPKVDWREQLHSVVTDRVSNDYDYTIPNRRVFPDTYLPSLSSYGMTKFTVAIDVSYSVIRDREAKIFEQFMTELNAIRNQFNPEKVEIILFSDHINATYEVQKYEEIKDIPFSIGGGTEITPVFDLIAKNPPELLLVFTDHEVCRPVEKSKYTCPVIWLILKTKASSSPLKGHVIEITHNDFQT